MRIHRSAMIATGKVKACNASSYAHITAELPAKDIRHTVLSALSALSALSVLSVLSVLSEICRISRF